MLGITGIFKNRTPNAERLLAFGFAKTANQYTISYELLNGQFQMDVAISAAGAVSVRVLDAASRELYARVHTCATHRQWMECSYRI